MTDFSPVPVSGAAFPWVPRWHTLLASLALARNPLRNLNRLHARHGNTVGMYLGGLRPTIVSRDPALLQHILQKNHRLYHKSDLTHGLIRYLGRGLLTNEGADWLRQRRLIQPGFHRQRLAGLTRLLQSAAEQWTQELRARTTAGPVRLDIHEAMTRVTFRVMARATFGTGMREAEQERLSEVLTQIQAFYVRTIRQPYLRPWLHLTGQYRRHDELSQELRTLVRRYIRARQAQPPADDLLQMLLEARYEDTGEPMTEDQLLDEVNILLLAGHETSANALSWAFYLLATHPAVAAQVRAERAAAGLTQRPPAFEELPRLPYAQQVVQETLRLYPPAWILDRVALTADEFQGQAIAPGTLFSLYLYGLHRHPELWPEPDAFRPERFAPGSQPPVPVYGYLPFGGGPRLCIGNHFALTEMQLVILETLHHFTIRPTTAAEPRPVPLITLRPQAGLVLEFDLLPPSQPSAG